MGAVGPSVIYSSIPSPSSLLSAYASFSTSIMLFRTTFNQLVPPSVQEFVRETIRFYWRPKSSKVVLVIHEKTDSLQLNHMFDAAQTYLTTKITFKTNRLKVSKTFKEPQIDVSFAQAENISDQFEGVPLIWTYLCEDLKSEKTRRYNDLNSEGIPSQMEKRSLELSFDHKHKDKVINSFLPYVVKRADEIKAQKRAVKLHSLRGDHYGDHVYWTSVNMDHPTTFNKLAMDPKLKKQIMDDLDLFVERREFYKQVGKAWKRGYLLYGPPGTGKSSLIAAIANYLKFDVYDLQLTDVKSDCHMRKLMMAMSNRSILVIEDIDCSVELPDRANLKTNSAAATSSDPLDPCKNKNLFSLSGLLNFIDGLWSCCGDSRIIIFTTNHKERLDPALLRPGRMDVHINMSYITIDGFKTLAANYLGIDDHHIRFGEIKELIETVNATPAEVAEELLRSTNAEVALGGVVSLLKRKRAEAADDELKRNKTEEGDKKNNNEVIENGIEAPEAKKPKISS